MRLADVDALKQTFCAECDRSIKCEDCDIDYHFEHLAPTVDAVEVVRCKDCKYYNLQHHYCEGIGYWFGIEDEWSDNGYCYKGERKEDANN